MTSLITQAMKKLLDENNVRYASNTLAGIIAVITSLLISIGYIIIYNIIFSPVILVYIVALIILSWLCAMLGYDKVMQTISQMKG